MSYPSGIGSSRMVALPDLPQDWRADGVCHPDRRPPRLDPNIFFSPLKAETEKAKAVCASCPARVDCLEYSLDASAGLAKGTHLSGVFAGLVETDRHPLRRLRTDHRYRHGCLCDYCRQVNAAFHGETKRLRNGPDARHGYRSTKSRGCDCRSCRFAGSLAWFRAKSA